MRRFLLSCFVANGFAFGWAGTPALASPQALEGEIRNIDFESKSIGEVRKVRVYLPPGHDPKKSYPVVYAADSFDGVNIKNVEPLITSGQIPPIIIVGLKHGPDPGMRQREYMPQASPADFNAHEKWVVEEVLPWAEKEFGASKDRRERVTYGSSNSGPWAVTMASRHPDLFGNVYAMMVYGLITSTFKKELKDQPKDLIRFFLVAGSQDQHGVEENQAIEEIVKAKGHPVFSQVIEKEGHSHSLQRKMLPKLLVETFGKKEKEPAKDVEKEKEKQKDGEK